MNKLIECFKDVSVIVRSITNCYTIPFTEGNGRPTLSIISDSGSRLGSVVVCTQRDMVHVNIGKGSYTLSIKDCNELLPKVLIKLGL